MISDQFDLIVGFGCHVKSILPLLAEVMVRGIFPTTPSIIRQGSVYKNVPVDGWIGREGG